MASIDDLVDQHGEETVRKDFTVKSPTDSPHAFEIPPALGDQSTEMWVEVDF